MSHRRSVDPGGRVLGDRFLAEDACAPKRARRHCCYPRSSQNGHGGEAEIVDAKGSLALRDEGAQRQGVGAHGDGDVWRVPRKALAAPCGSGAALSRQARSLSPPESPPSPLALALAGHFG